MDVQAGFWQDSETAYYTDVNVTALDGCCTLCISQVQCQRYDVASTGCKLYDTANTTAPLSSDVSAAGLGERQPPRSSAIYAATSVEVVTAPRSLLTVPCFLR